jgi:hypothetical protein
VARYRAALGPDSPFLERLLRTPWGLLGAEPELVLATAALAVVAFIAARREPIPVSGAPRAGLERGSYCIAALVLGLVAGDVFGGAPTHHGERTLLSVWFWCAILLAHLAELTRRRNAREHQLAIAAGLIAACVGWAAIRPRFERDAFADRRAEIDLGERARRRAIERLAIDATDYGYFALIASFGKPALVLDDRDPRKAPSRDRLAESPEDVGRQLASQGVRWLAVPSARAELTRSIAQVRERNQHWALVELVH